MGTKERKERERTEMRRAILDAARQLFIAGGYSNVPIRRVAAEIEYSAAAIYRYFPTKHDIFNALAEEGLGLLISRETVAGGAPDMPPLEKLRQVFWGVYEFGKMYPEYFYLIFVDRSAPGPGDHVWRMVDLMRAEVGRVVEECIASGDLPSRLDPAMVHAVGVSCMHGVAALLVCRRYHSEDDADAIARGVLDVVIAGLKSGSLSGSGARLPDLVSAGKRPSAREKRTGRRTATASTKRPRSR